MKYGSQQRLRNLQELPHANRRLPRPDRISQEFPNIVGLLVEQCVTMARREPAQLFSPERCRR